MKLSQDQLDQFNRNALYTTIGIHLDKAEDGRAEAVLTPNPKVCWPFPDQPHGGILFTVMDTTMAWAVMSRLDKGFSCATIDLHIQYLAPAKGSPYTCLAETTHQTRHLAFVRADIRDAHSRPIASGQATFRIIKMDLV
jgi:uncharacterized protein (TIGR00369 family)